MTSAAQADSATPYLANALPPAVDPYALSLNENPFPPLPAVRATGIRNSCPPGCADWWPSMPG